MSRVFGFAFDIWRGLWFYIGHYIERIDNALADLGGEDE